MKSYAKRILALLLCVLTFASLFVMSADAAKITSAWITSNTYGKNVITFYANTNDGEPGTVKVQLTNGAGTLLSIYEDDDGNEQEAKKYRRGYWEVKIYGRNSTNDSWEYISKTNVKGSTSKIFTMKGYSQYKIRVYAWNTATIGNYIGGNFNSSAYWISTPSANFKAYKNCYLAK